MFNSQTTKEQKNSRKRAFFLTVRQETQRILTVRQETKIYVVSQLNTF